MSFAVKPIVFLLALAVAVHAAPGDPAEVALGFLEKVRRGDVNLEPGGDTALSPATGREKRRQIASRLERLADDLGDGKLEVGEVREETDHAAVVVYLADGFDPARLRAFPVALVKHGAQWRPAPVPASFENTGFGYPAMLRNKLRALEHWMIRQQVVGLEALRQQLGSRLKREVEARIDTAEYLELGAAEVARRFLAACEARDLAAVLGYLGGARPELPDDWSLRLQSAEEALEGGQTPRPWRLLVAPEVARAVVHQEITSHEALISVGCLDPAGRPGMDATPRVELVHLELTRGLDGFWQVDPPPAFFLPFEDEGFDPDEGFDEDLLDNFPRRLRERLPAAPAASARAAADSLVRALRSPRTDSLLALLDLAGDPATGRVGAARAARAWWLANDPETPRHALPLDFHESGDAAGVLIQYFSSREPDRADVKRFIFRRDEKGWMLVPGLRVDEKSAGDDARAVLAWSRDRLPHWQEHWRGAALAESVELERIEGPAPQADEAVETVREWLAAVSAGDLARALELSAVLGDEAGAVRALRNLGFEVSAARALRRPASVDGALVGETWAAVPARGGSAEEPTFPLYPVVATPAGPRVLVETDLFAVPGDNRARAFLNRAALKRLRNFADREAIDELAALLEKHQAEIDG